MSLVLGAFLGMVAASPAPADIERSARKVLDAEYQTTLPGHEPQAGAGKSAENRRRPEERPAGPRRQQQQSAPPQTPAIFGQLSTILLYIIGAVIIAVLVISVLRDRVASPDDATAHPGGDAARPERPAVVVKPLGDAERLAQEGRFGEAIHILLLCTLEELVRATPGGLPASLTSREIIARVRMPEAARAALSELVRAVELSHFGHRTPAASDYQRCRDCFAGFAQAYTRRPA